MSSDSSPTKYLLEEEQAEIVEGFGVITWLEVRHTQTELSEETHAEVKFPSSHYRIQGFFRTLGTTILSIPCNRMLRRDDSTMCGNYRQQIKTLESPPCWFPFLFVYINAS